MMIRQIKETQWAAVCREIAAHGKAAPVSLQFDLPLHFNGVCYILKVQTERKHKIAALQAVRLPPTGERGENPELIENNAVLSSLLELFISQGVGRRGG